MIILLADDEKMVRFGLESMLDELYPHEHTYIHAKNGRDVITQVKEQLPDIAFLDIKMPLLNGLEALAQCKELSPSTIWIILTGYADFTYAQKAISLSAYSYILKPIDIETLKEVTERIIQKKCIQATQEHFTFSHNIILSFNMASHFNSNECDFQPECTGSYVIYQFYIDKYIQEEQHTIKQQLCECLEQYCKKSTFILNYCLFFNHNGQLCLVCNTYSTSRLTHYIEAQYNTFPDKSVTCFYGNGKTIKEIYDISLKISNLAIIRLILPAKKPFLISATESLENLSLQIKFCEMIEQAVTFYMEQRMGSYTQSLNRIAEMITFRSLFSDVCCQTLSGYLADIFRHNFQFTDFDSFLKELYTCPTNRTHTSVICSDISKIQDFIYNNYEKDVSIAYVSECFGLSPTYLSKIFHERTGEKYIDFVTKVRIENAKKIISANPCISMKILSESVGYSSARHFSKIFQKYTGLLPSCYFKDL